MATQRTDQAEVVSISHGELIKLHASKAARALGLETGEFLSLWEAGKLDRAIADSTHPDVVRWAMLMSFGREEPSRSR